MIIPDDDRAERKLSQIGYYRLSGYWYPCRQFAPGGRRVRLDDFQKDVNFNDLIQLYLFDKKLRLLMLDAIERIEIHIRSVIAHEMGYHDPLAYQKDSFIQPSAKKIWIDHNLRERSSWREWTDRHNQKINESREECILHHKNNGKAMPFWVVIEAWDFGTISKYFSLLNPTYQNKICQRIGIPKPFILKQWLQEINILRNRCAHHTRIWNNPLNNPLPVIPNNVYFQSLNLDEAALKRIYGMICVLWFLVRKIGPSSSWLDSVCNLVNTKPSIDSCPNTAMGFSDNEGFPRHLF